MKKVAASSYVNLITTANSYVDVYVDFHLPNYRAVGFDGRVPFSDIDRNVCLSVCLLLLLPFYLDGLSLLRVNGRVRRLL